MSYSKETEGEREKAPCCIMMKGTPSDTDKLADPVAAKFLLVTQHHLTTQQNSQQDLLLSHCTVQDLTGWTSKPVSNIGVCVCVCVCVRVCVCVCVCLILTGL